MVKLFQGLEALGKVLVVDLGIKYGTILIAETVSAKDVESKWNGMEARVPNRMVMYSTVYVYTVGSFKLQFSLGFVTSCYVIMNISIA